MIVLDEHLNSSTIIEAISTWYRGSVVIVTDLRPNTHIGDDAIPMLLRDQDQPTFVTINAGDFWQHVKGDPRFCIICMALPDDRVEHLPYDLRLVLRHPNFRTHAKRMGHVLRVTHEVISYYSHTSSQIKTAYLP